MSEPSALSQIGGWLIIPAAATILYLAHRAYTKRHPKNTRPVTESTQPVTRRATTRKPCTVPGCDDEATVYVGASFETWQFCMTHGLPYLLRQDIDITDRDFREVMDDARRITREASGGVA